MEKPDPQQRLQQQLVALDMHERSFNATAELIAVAIQMGKTKEADRLQSSLESSYEMRNRAERRVLAIIKETGHSWRSVRNF